MVPNLQSEFEVNNGYFTKTHHKQQIIVGLTRLGIADINSRLPLKVQRCAVPLFVERAKKRNTKS